MLGLYAARRYKSEEIITVYVGDDIGAANGTLDDYHGYRIMERMERDDGGRHVMQIGDRLVDGEQGYTMAQYINSAYKVKGWVNKAELLGRNNQGGGGTIRVMEGKVIQEGEEILMAYHDSYWSRWDDERRGRGRRRKHNHAKRAAPAADGGAGADAGAAVGADPQLPGWDGDVRVHDNEEGRSADVVVGAGAEERVLPCVEADGVGAAVVLPTEEGVRVTWPVAHATGRRGGRSGERGRSGGRGRGGEGRGGPSRQRRVNSQNIRWTAVARNAYMQRQSQFGRGEGGGVT